MGPPGGSTQQPLWAGVPLPPGKEENQSPVLPLATWNGTLCAHVCLHPHTATYAAHHAHTQSTHHGARKLVLRRGGEVASRPITSGRTSLWAGRKLRQHRSLSWRRGFQGTRAGGCRGVRTGGGTGSEPWPQPPSCVPQTPRDQPWEPVRGHSGTPGHACRGSVSVLRDTAGFRPLSAQEGHSKLRGSAEVIVLQNAVCR